MLNLYELFHTRASLHHRVYTHKKAKAIEYMVVDVLCEADRAWGNSISQSVFSPADFSMLDDTVLKRIEISTDESLRPAQAILKRLRRRELYRYVNEFTGALASRRSAAATLSTACHAQCRARGCRTSGRT